jgi:site-specific recombinase XerD
MPRTLPKSITPAEFARLLAQPNRRYPTGRRNRALLAGMYFEGLRVSEVIGLAPADVELESPESGGWLHVRNSKGGADRDLALVPEFMVPLAEWWEVRPESEHLFCTLEGEELSARYLHAMVTRYARKAGVMVRKRVTLKGADGKPVKDGTKVVKVDREVPAWPHSLRHSFAINMVDAGAETPAIQQALGHADLQTTSVYTLMRAESVRAAVLAGAARGAAVGSPRSQAAEDMADRLLAAAA